MTPPQCAGCGSEGAWLCADCRGQLPPDSGVCYRCSRFSAGGLTCPDCVSGASLDGVTVGARYAGVIKLLVLKLKFDRSAAVADELAGLVVGRLNRADFDLITAIPVAPRRYRERGYNQSELLARALAARLALPYRSVLERSSSNHQLGQGRRERLAQIQGVFTTRQRLDGERVLLVDDVLTTGATLGEGARVLRGAGAGSVWGATAARD